ncbi:unnamed protein product [Bursaphelenchus okinawaensis]|uniref:histone acetyltransferase n=1 Tax=Bursaphelenchus okinawaensis TaxID=465554 RepID=A0A811L1A1_9BILA|nr:unnamed protein product [Bursaphelenchus okinawaensis]CAG9115158.1 unnamed protein product [Bursaphelenchus okinawaensis]
MVKRAGRGLSVKDLPDHLAELLRQNDVKGTPLTRTEVSTQLAKEHGTSRENTEKALDALIQMHKIVEVATESGSTPVFHDLLRFKMSRERRLRIGPNTDLFSVVRKSLIEKSARSSQYAMSVSEIHDYVQLTYQLEGNSDEHLFAGIMKTVKAMLKRDLVEEKVPLHNNDSKYFATSSLMLNTSLPALDPKPSTSAHAPLEVSLDNNASSCSPSPNSSSSFKRREKRLSEASQQNSDASKTELKSLQDSLSSYFTPSNSRRSRVAQSSFSLEHFQSMDEDKLGPLEIDVNRSLDLKSEDDGSVTSPTRHHADRLLDSLSPYFSANTERRRKHEKGEYKQLCNGIPLKKKGRSSDNGVKDVLHDVKNDEEMDHVHRHTPSVSSMCGENADVSRVSPALKRKHSSFDSEDLSIPSHSVTPSDCASPSKRRPRKLANRTSANLLKRARQHQARLAHSLKLNGTSRKERSTSNVNNSSRKSRLTAEPVHSTVISNSAVKITSPLRKSGSFSPVKFLMEPSTSKENASPVKIRKEDEEMFNKAHKIVQDRMDRNTKAMAEKGENAITIPKIRIGRYEIESLYSSPYPAEYAGVPLLYICEHCLMYMASDDRHKKKCRSVFPPGNEIYRKDNISVFEVDGNTARVYCRNLCLLAKLFMDHKTLYFDVEPFLFYVCVIRDKFGLHFAGYFSKEKYSHQKFNLACIVTLPAYQNNGIGRFLIDFSYLISRQESMLGTPERPLSDLGRIAYESYWRTAIFEFLYRKRQKGPTETLSLNDISRGTGIAFYDAVEVLVSEGFLNEKDGQLEWFFDWPRIEKHWETAKANPKRIWIDETKLRWTPRVYTPTIDMIGRSPIMSPVRLGLSRENDPNTQQVLASAACRRLFSPDKNRRRSEPEDQNQQSAKDSAASRKRQNRKNSKAAVLAPKNQLQLLTDDELDTNPPNKNSSSFVGPKHRQNAKDSRRAIPSSSSDDTDDDDFKLVGSAERRRSRPGRRPSAAAKNDKKRQQRETAKASDEADSSNSEWSRPASPAADKKRKAKEIVEMMEVSSEEELPTPKPRQPAATGKKGKPSAAKKTGKGKKSRKAGSDSDNDQTYTVGRPPGKKGTGKRPGRPPLGDKGRKGVGKKIENITDSKTSKTDGKANGKPAETEDKSSAKGLTLQVEKSALAVTAPTSEASSRTTSPRPSTSTNLHLTLNESDDDDEANRSDLSPSPGPLSGRGNRISLVAETMNMGGEPDTVNMGGEPDDEDESHQQFAATPKAPKPHMIEDEYSNHVGEGEDGLGQNLPELPLAELPRSLGHQNLSEIPLSELPQNLSDLPQSLSHNSSLQSNIDLHSQEPALTAASYTNATELAYQQPWQIQSKADYQHGNKADYQHSNNSEYQHKASMQEYDHHKNTYNPHKASLDYQHKNMFNHKSSVPDFRQNPEFSQQKSLDYAQIPYNGQYQHQEGNNQYSRERNGQYQSVPQPELYQEPRMVNNSKALECAAPILSNLPLNQPVLEQTDENVPMPILEKEIETRVQDDNTPVQDEEGLDAPPPLSPEMAKANEATDNGPPVLDSNPGPSRKRSSNPAQISEPQIQVNDRMDNLAIDCEQAKSQADVHFNSNDFSKIQRKNVHQSPILQPNSNSPANYKPSSLPQQPQIFSPSAQIHTPNSHQPLSQNSTSTASETMPNTCEMLSPPNLSKPEVANYNIPPQPTTQSFSPPKMKEKKTSIAATTTSHQSSQARRRNTTDGSTQKPIHRTDSGQMNANLPGFPFMPPYVPNGLGNMPNSFPINYTNQMPNQYDYMQNNANYLWNNYQFNAALPQNVAKPAGFPNPAMANQMDVTAMPYYNPLQPNAATPQMPPANGAVASNFVNFANALANPSASSSYYYG